MLLSEKIQTNRLYLKNLTPALIDDAYLGWMNDQKVICFLESRFCPPKSLDELRRFVKQINSSSHSLFFGIFLKADGRHIGNIKLGPVSREHRRSSIAFLIGDRAMWGQGISGEAVSAAAKYAISRLGLVKLTAGAYESNTASIKMLKRIGFIEEALLPNHVECDGRREAVLLFAYYGGQKMTYGKKNGQHLCSLLISTKKTERC